MNDHFKIEPSNQDYAELLQITDTHIFADEKDTFDDVDTRASLKQVLDLARGNDWPVDTILATGDLVHDARTIAYERLLEVFTSIEEPVFCLPGNHDSPGLMYELLNTSNVHTSKSIEIGAWVIIMLDSFLLNTHAGQLQQHELDLLGELLEKHQDKHVLVCLHHPPVEIGSDWMDGMRLNNPQEFFAVLDRYNHVKAVLWGHIHQEFNAERKGVRLMASPSTCVQFMPESGEYRKDGRAAGYRYLKLHSSGEIDTHTRRLHGVTG
ncbi:MAG: 3',5'-cyclic-AMP phosphodiesterase [Gammaproteobacteria bacterium]|nr:MAG: 3',5'-cyclic-AMP phosphodiesterase [Gammaproteobacteria bacterium]RKZ71196.1 MAG: 3',5'-cyclic-AMP phosphodiesterase [Gammaproteobacteria bacterium]